jgi:signal peptidase I
MRLFRRSLRLLAATVSVAVFAACVAFAGLNYAGFRSAPMLSGSMRNVMPVGSLVIVKPVSAPSVHVGDVVMFRAPGYDGDYTHRIHAITKTRNGLAFTTKGDENPEVDPWRLRSVNGQGHFGKLVADIPYVGYAIEYSRDWRVRLLLLALASTAALALVLRKIWTRDQA